MKASSRTLWASVLFFFWSNASAQEVVNYVKVVGAMKEVMWKGKLSGTIDLDTLSNKQHLFGLGPVEYLAGEILIIDGKAYRSTVLTDSTMKVEETYAIKAPFFAYANIMNLTQVILPDSIQSAQQLEQFLERTTKKQNRPVLFRFTGEIEQATIHVVNLPKGSTVTSPDEAHQGQRNFVLTHQLVEIVGFFSTAHKGIFTHHDTYLHMHLITSDRQKMGHLDEVRFKKGTIMISHP
ncbi:MAG TPA: acetolactate decarboxylase [Cyclobacteriaceae bacterium]|nr:acetolactate decarboxylase [Cyclobacteriaceae bacterium]HRF32432.1 acetolactate decarboxylase [Cyclobacteriaceae bacterium]